MISPKTIIHAFKTVLHAFYKAGYNTIYHDGIEHAGYLAFLGLLALFPFLVFVVALAGFIGEGQAGIAFIKLVFSVLPPHMVKALTPRVAEISSGPPQGLLTVAILGAIWTSSSAVEGYRTVLNRAYHVHTPPAYIWRRLLSIAQILIISFAVVMAIIVLVVLPIAWEKIELVFGKTDSMGLDVGHKLAAISLLVIFCCISIAYYFLPNIKQNLHSVVPGAGVVTLLWLGAAQLLSLYLSQFNQVNLIYGSLGGVIAALLFFYVSNIIFIYGAEFNYLLKKALGEKIEQKQLVLELPAENK
jgi:membrane protein